jgi:transcriptional regulator with XRE-family HTH domain
MTALASANINSEIGYRIERLREALDMTPAQFTKITGISTQALSNYKSGLRRIYIDQAIQLCEATQVTLDWVYFGDPSGLTHNLATKLGYR